MELPSALREAVDAASREISAGELAAASAALTARYRGAVVDGRRHVADRTAALAYALVRMPATYAAVRAAMARVAEVRPDFRPQTVLDFGSGPGTAVWAAEQTWESIRSAVAVEASADMAEMGRRFWAGRANGAAPRLEWTLGELERVLAPLDAVPVARSPAAQAATGDFAAGRGRADLVIGAYVLNELPGGIDEVVQRMWDRAGGGILFVEPGTPAGWRRILDVRRVLIGEGAVLVAPCPHAFACPLLPPDWCHFSRRVARSREHRMAKGGELGWEDEKYSYVAALRPREGEENAGNGASPSDASRVLAPTRSAPGRVWLKLCQPDGTAAERLVTKREGDAFKAARRAEWGDRFSERSGIG